MLEYGIPSKWIEKNLDKAIACIIKGQQPFPEDSSRDYPFDEENLKKQVAYGKKKQGRGKK
jgi:hypothetical protein